MFQGFEDCGASGQRTCSWKDHRPLWRHIHSVLIEILMLGKAAPSLPSRRPGILSAFENKHEGQERGKGTDSSPASIPGESVSSSIRRQCRTRVAIKANCVILAGAPRDDSLGTIRESPSLAEWTTQVLLLSLWPLKCSFKITSVFHSYWMILPPSNNDTALQNAPFYNCMNYTTWFVLN